MVSDFLGGRLSNKSNREGLPFAALSPAPHLGRYAPELKGGNYANIKK